MDLQQKFTLSDQPTQQQLDFFNTFGFIHFKHVFTPEQIGKGLDEIKRIEQAWIEEQREKVNGIPVKYGKDEKGNTIVQRFAFTSQHSGYLHQMLQDKR